MMTQRTLLGDTTLHCEAHSVEKEDFPFAFPLSPSPLLFLPSQSTALLVNFLRPTTYLPWYPDYASKHQRSSQSLVAFSAVILEFKKGAIHFGLFCSALSAAESVFGISRPEPGPQLFSHNSSDDTSRTSTGCKSLRRDYKNHPVLLSLSGYTCGISFCLGHPLLISRHLTW